MAGLLKITFVLLLLNLHSQDFQYIEPKPGETLWEIAQIYLKDPQKWDKIVEYNHLPPDPYQVLTGKKLKVPVNLIKEELRAAHFEKIEGEVKVRPANKSQWTNAKDVKELFKGDTIRTNVNSYADVRFYTGQILNLFANSMVVLKPPQDEESDIRLFTGQIKTKGSRIITVSAKITPKTKNTEIAAKIKEDLSTVVQVHKGEAIVESKKGKIDLKEGFTTEVKLNAPPSIPHKMPDITQEKIDINFKVEKGILSINNRDVENKQAPTTTTDSKSGQKISRNVVNIDLNKTISGYRIQVAKDEEFKSIIFDRRFDVFKTLNLSEYIPKGRYYFRIAYIDLLGFEQEFSKPKEIIIE